MKSTYKASLTIVQMNDTHACFYPSGDVPAR